MSEMSNEEVKQLGQRALAAGIPWMVGMRTTCGATVTRVYHGEGIRLYSDDYMKSMGYAPFIPVEYLGDFAPDLTDPATLGAALVHALSKVEGAQSIEVAARELVANLEAEGVKQ